MANFQTITNDPAPAPTEPADDQIEPEAEPETDPAELDLSESDEAPEPGEPAGTEIDQEAEYLVDGELVKGKDLLGQRLMQADYTRKTQALAEASKAMKERAELAEDDRDDLVSWAEGFQDPVRMEYELETNFPEAYRALKETIIEQALAEADLAGKPELRYYQDSRKAALEKIGQKAEQEASERTNGRKSRRAEVATLRTTLEGWTKSAMESAGLNPADVTQRTAVQDRLVAGHKDEKWSESTFATAAKHVAKLTGAKAPPPKADPAEEKPKLPVIKPVGHKAKPEQRLIQEQARAKAAKPQSWDALRKKFGAR